VEQLTAHDPRRIGPFEVLGRLGAGGMGLVYLARSAAGRRVAIKTVRAELAEDPLFRSRFKREIEAAKKVSGFYTAAVVDADADAPVPWLATAYVPAPSLEDLVGECGPLPVDAVRWLAAGIAEALQSIHQVGLVHRDLKPSNVLVTEDGPRVIDFGIAAGVSHTRLTMTNVAVGTPAYMSPEQARDSRTVTGASDVFSLGSLIVFSATGHAPYHGANPVETVFMLLREQPDLSGLPAELAPLVRSLMRPAPERRLTPAQLQEELAPHLFARGDDSEGEAGDWLPPHALALIERRRARRALPAAGAPPALPAPGPAPALPGPSAASAQPAAYAAPGGAATHPAAGAPAQPPSPVPGTGYPPPGPGYRSEGVPAAAAGHPGAGPAVPPGQQPQGTTDYPPASYGPSGPGSPAGTPGRPGPEPSHAEPSRADDPGPGLAVAKAVGVSAASAVDPRTMPPMRPAAGVRLDTPPTTPLPPPARRHAAGQPPAAPDPAEPGGIRLGASALPIGPGPRAAVPQGPLPGPASEWVLRPEQPAAPAVPAAPAPEPGAAEPEAPRWRPWRFRMSNDIWGSPVVSGGTLFVSSFELHALDIASGRRTFKSRDVAWAMAVADGRVHAADGPNLYTVSASDGGELWRTALRGWVYSLDAGGGAVCVGCRGGGVQVRSAIDGSEMWRADDAQQEYENPQSGPCVVGESVYYHGGGQLRAVDLTTGRPRWSVPVGEDVPARPVLHGGVLFVTAGVHVVALDEESGGERWRHEGDVVLFTPPALHADARIGETLYVADYLGTVSALDAASGALRWRARTGGRQGADPVVVADGTVLVASGDTVYAFDAAEGTERWRYGTRGEIAGAPSAAGGLVHLGSRDGSLHTLDLATGRLRWKLDTGGEITGSPVVGEGKVFACSKDRCVYALDAYKGTAR
jgi:outer membrane protein assembly factor BamB/tRNA A-37 threonylcarbamoyl transferase component Bud32